MTESHPCPAIAALSAHYPTVIAQMKKEFNAHEFILKLAQQHQREYVQALNHPPYLEGDPFMNVHRELARQLNEHPTLVRRHASQPDVKSHDIFGQPNECSNWERV